MKSLDEVLASPLDHALDELLVEYLEEQTTELATREQKLEVENRRLRIENKKLKLQHDFAFASWHQAVKRSGRLSAELTASQVALARGSGVHDQVTVANAGARIPPRFDQENAKTCYFRHSGGAIVVKTGRA